MSDEAARVRVSKSAEAQACGIDDAFISTLVESFYDAVRQDDRLGPIFAKHVQDWPLHLARMKDFWSSVMIQSGRFSGNPMQKHIAIGGLEGAHFTRWQALWEQTVTQLAPNRIVRDRFSQAAQRIGESLLTGIEIERGGLKAAARRIVS